MGVFGPASGWQFVTSETQGLSGGPGVSVGAGGGVLVVRDPSGKLYDLEYVAASGGIGCSVLPVTVSVSRRAFPSYGIGDIWLGPAVGGRQLSLADFIGPLTIYELGASIGPLGRATELILCHVYADAPRAAIAEAVMGLFSGPAAAAAPFAPLLMQGLARTYSCGGFLEGLQFAPNLGAGIMVHKGNILHAYPTDTRVAP